MAKKKKKQYKARQGTIFNDNDASVIGSFFEINFQEGRMTPNEVVKAAKNKKSPIHKYFDWDDETAAHKYRLRQARKMISAIYVKIDGKEVRAYESVYIEELDSRHYQDIDSILNAPDLSGQVLENAIREINFWKEKYKNFSELSAIVNAIEKTSKKLNKRRA